MNSSRKIPRKDHRHFDEQFNFESTRGCVTAYPSENGTITIATSRGIPGRKVQIAILTKEHLTDFISYLQKLIDKA